MYSGLSPINVNNTTEKISIDPASSVVDGFMSKENFVKLSNALVLGANTVTDSGITLTSTSSIDPSKSGNIQVFEDSAIMTFQDNESSASINVNKAEINIHNDNTIGAIRMDAGSNPLSIVELNTAPNAGKTRLGVLFNNAFKGITVSKDETEITGKLKFKTGNTNSFMIPKIVPAVPENGMIYLNETTGKVLCRIANAWVPLN